MILQIKKAQRVEGATLVFRNITVDDAEFSWSLRRAAHKQRFLSATSPSVEDQVAFLRRYEQALDQAYFVICDRNMTRLGCVRLYDAQAATYCWGSWILVDGLSPFVAIESALLVYAYGRHLGFTEARLEVRKDNIHVQRFHERLFGAERIGEKEHEIQYRVSSSAIEASLQKNRNLLTHPLRVTSL